MAETPSTMLALGTPLPSFTLPDLTGKTILSDDFRSAPALLEAAKGFRRVQGCQDMPALVAALRARDARLGLGESSEMVA